MSEPDPIRLVIMKALTDQIAINADLDGAVFRGRDYYDDQNDVLPMVTIMEDLGRGDDYPTQTKDGGPTIVELPLVIVGIAIEDDLNPTDNATRLMYRVIDALKKIKRDARGVRGETEYLGIPNIDKIQIGAGKALPAYADGSTGLAFFRLPAMLTYVEN